jgi:ribulose bisphosphate carboxylase small subunit
MTTTQKTVREATSKESLAEINQFFADIQESVINLLLVGKMRKSMRISMITKSPYQNKCQPVLIF